MPQLRICSSIAVSIEHFVDGIGTSEDVDMTEERLEDDAALTPTLKLLKKKFNPLSSTFDSRSNGEKVAEKEIEMYRQLPPCSQDECVLSWWKNHADVLPRLTVFAKEILAIPASTSSSERLFSIAGLFDTEKRGTMKLETLEVLTLLKTNEKVLKENYIDIDDMDEVPEDITDQESYSESDSSDIMEDSEGEDMERSSTGGGRNSDIESEYDSEAIDDNVEEVRNDKIESDSEEDI